MTKEEIGSILKQLRISSGKTQKEVAEIIGRKQQIIGHWETGYSQPDANTLFTLCEIYGTTVDDAFGFRKNTISQEDLKLIEKYHDLDDYGKETVNYILNREADRTQQIRDTALRQSPAAIRIYTYMRKIAAAGTGFYFDDIPTDTIEAPYLENADFIIGVSGDSMEPTFSDGDLVYVEKRQVIDTGDIGIFIVNGQCYIKEAGENGLISHNQKYALIPGSEQINCVGKVLGKVTID
jgi:phage repressor protein C with HTH and peptisase S24 domain